MAALLRSDSTEKPYREIIPPEPPTSILMVPFGPRLLFMTSYRPFAALMFMERAAPLPMTSALGFKVFTDVILL